MSKRLSVCGCMALSFEVAYYALFRGQWLISLVTVAFTSWIFSFVKCSPRIPFEHWLCKNQYEVQTVALENTKTKAQVSFKRAHSLMRRVGKRYQTHGVNKARMGRSHWIKLITELTQLQGSKLEEGATFKNWPRYAVSGRRFKQATWPGQWYCYKHKLLHSMHSEAK